MSDYITIKKSDLINFRDELIEEIRVSCKPEFSKSFEKYVNKKTSKILQQIVQGEQTK